MSFLCPFYVLYVLFMSLFAEEKGQACQCQRTCQSVWKGSSAVGEDILYFIWGTIAIFDCLREIFFLLRTMYIIDVIKQWKMKFSYACVIWKKQSEVISRTSFFWLNIRLCLAAVLVWAVGCAPVCSLNSLRLTVFDHCQLSWWSTRLERASTFPMNNSNFASIFQFVH